MYSEEEIKKILKQINWDTTHSTEELYKVFARKVDSIGGLTIGQIYMKLLKHLYFNDLYKLLGKERLKDALSDDIIRGVFPPLFRERLYNAKRLLYP